MKYLRPFVSVLHIVVYGICAIHCGTDDNWREPCIENNGCSQQVSPTTTWPCTIHKHNVTGCTKDPFFPMVAQYELPSQPVNLKINWYPVSHVLLDQHDTFLALNVSVDIDLTTGSSNLQGIHFIIRGLQKSGVFHYDYFNQEICRTYNLSSADTRWSSDYYMDNVTFYYDCFRPMSPNVLYQVQVILLPTSDTGVMKSISKDYRMPSCSDHSGLFYECDESDDAASWGPSIIDIISIYETVNLTFDLPPPEMDLNSFVVSLFKEGTEITYKVVQLSEGSELPKITVNTNVTMVTTVFDNVSAGVYVFKILPDDTVCHKSNMGCVMTKTNHFTVIANPCKANPCGHYGNCTAIEEYYNCTCQDGHDDMNGTCLGGISQTPSESPSIQRLLIATSVVLGCASGLVLIFKMYNWYQKRNRTEIGDSKPEPSHEEHDTPLLGVEHAKYSSPRILAIYTKDCPEYEKVVKTTCRVLRKGLGCDIRLDLWEAADIVRMGYPAWVNRQFEKAEKILFFVSKGAKTEWDALHDSKQTHHPPKEDAMFRVAMGFMCSDVSKGIHSKRRGQYIFAYFPFSSSNDVPVTLKQFGQPNIYNIPENVESMYIELLDLESSTPSVDRTTGDNFTSIKSSEIWTKMKQAIHTMTSFVNEHPNWYEDKHGSNEAGGGQPSTSHAQRPYTGMNRRSHDCVDGAETSDQATVAERNRAQGNFHFQPERYYEHVNRLIERSYDV